MQQQQDCGNQRAGMSDPDPPDEINDGEAPSNRDVHTPNPDANCEKDSHRVEKHHQQQKGNAESQKPSGPLALAQDNRADLVGYRRDRVAGFDHPWLANFGRALKRIRFHAEFLLKK